MDLSVVLIDARGDCQISRTPLPASFSPNPFQVTVTAANTDGASTATVTIKIPEP